jgi:NADPH-dependent 2,4-dienoyl-CoA reductase/sulfur reductase-like enzyme/CxxC motif-containing protein
MQKIEANLAIIGGGPAGLAAAISAYEAGIKNIIIIERDEQLGGLLYQCIHNGFGLQYFKKDLSGPEYAWRFLEKLHELDIEVYLETMVTDITPDKEITAVNSEKGTIIINAKSIVLAMGCRERTRGAINIPGSRPAGVFTAGTAQRFINVEGYFPGEEVVILGSGDIGMIMARRLTLEGAKVKAVVEILPYIGGLVRNENQCLKDFNVPTYLKHTVTKIHGNERVEKVTIAELDDKMQPISGTERDIKCDTLLLSVGLIPENEVSKKANVELSNIGGPVVDENMQTNIPGIFAAGNVVHVHDLVDYVTLGGEKAGKCAAQYVKDELASSRRKIKVSEGENVRYVVPQYISEGEDVSLYLRVTKPANNVDLRLNKNVWEKHYDEVKPSEMIKIDLKRKVIDNLNGELIVDCIMNEEEANEVSKGDKDVRTIICLNCPLGCKIDVTLNKDGEIEKIEGNQCPKGEDYARKEMFTPERVLTATVRTSNPDQPLLPVRTNDSVPKEKILDCMKVLSKVIVDEPLDIGDVVLANILGTGVDVIASLKIPFHGNI